MAKLASSYKTQCIIVMGVSGCGKSTIGALLAHKLSADFVDGDDLHPHENIAKMARGEALNDADRRPWLKAIHQCATSAHNNNQSIVIVCSALKKRYRDIFRANISALTFLFLQGSYGLIKQRMEARQDHFMKADMLNGQFAALEVPDLTETDVITADITQSAETLVEQAIARLSKWQ